MKDGIFVFDNVIHMFDNTKDNIVDPAIAQSVKGLSQTYSADGWMPGLKSEEFWTQFPVKEAYRLLFEESDTDMAMAQTVPLMGGSWKRGFSPAERQYAFAKAYPERVIFCGGVDPISQGIDGSLYELERQAVEWNAKSFKFYQIQGKLHWRADDRDWAYPLYEKCLELGITCVQFHKGYPFGSQPMEYTRPNDLQNAARDFPDLVFINHHLGEPYIDETVSISARYKNVWVALSGFINIHPFRPEQSWHNIGRLLTAVGPDRLLYGSEAFLWPRPQSAVDLFSELTMPEELQDRYGYPAITKEMKSKMMGENMAKLMGIDISAKKKALYGDADAQLLTTIKSGDPVKTPDFSLEKAVKYPHVEAMNG